MSSTNMLYQEFVDSSQSLEYTYCITQDIFDAFQQLSHDLNPLHTDAIFAQRMGFPDRVMYGNILNAFVSHFVGMILPTPNVVIQTQDIQFRKPVFLGDTILLKSEIQDTSESVEIVNFKLKFFRTNSEKPQLVASGHVQVGLLHPKQ